MWSIKEKEKIDICTYVGQIFYALYEAVGTRRCGSLININPSGNGESEYCFSDHHHHHHLTYLSHQRKKGKPVFLIASIHRSRNQQGQLSQITKVLDWKLFLEKFDFFSYLMMYKCIT